MKKYCSAILGSVAAFGALTSHALEITIVESRAGGLNPAWYHEGLGNWANSTAKSTAPGTTQIAPSIGSRFATAEGAIFSVSPVLRDGASYTIDITHGVSSSIPTTFDVAVSATGGTVDVTNTPVFQQVPNNIWERVGTIVLNPGVTTPTVTFTKLTTGAGRFYADSIRFTLLDPCLTVPDIKTVNGPLAAGQTFVDVAGVTDTAQTVTVYADGVQIGQKTTGVAAGVSRVTTSPLVKGRVITATQTANGIESCNPSTGQLVGNGANPAIKIAITIRQTNLTDSVIGVNGGAPGGILKFIGATGAVGTLLAPSGAKTFYPSSDWQTVSFQRGDDWTNSIDPTFNWNLPDTTFGNVLAYNFGVFDALIFTSPEDTGPFAIYIDEFKNGDTLVQGFESAANGQSGSTFTQPSFSGTTSGFLLAQPPGTINPNIAVVTNSTADSGSQSLYVSWQFGSTNVASCLRLPAVATTTGSTPNPIVDLRLPITFRMLILPLGQQPTPKPGTATSGPGDQRVIRTGNITLRAVYGGTPPLSFQWRHNGSDIPGKTNASLTINNAQSSDGGTYTLRVSNAYGSGESPSGILTVDDVLFTDVMTPAWSLAPGSRPYLTNDGNTRSIAWSPATGNLLVASRSGNSNAIYALEGDTGAFKYTLQPPPGGFVGGTLPLNQVAVVDEGGSVTVYACNLTTDGATDNLKIYKWFGDYDNEIGSMIWEGNPAGDPNVHLRWGDAMTVRSVGGSHEVIVSSSGTMVAFIQPDFPSVVAGDISDVPAGALRLGLAITEGDILWGKTSGSPLYRVQMDASLRTGTILNSFSGLNTMSAIGVNVGGSLMAGVFVDTPDHFRLFDISSPGILTAADTELFATDNANANATGGIAFGDNMVYALDSNNGLIAMHLDTACLPDRLTIEPSGSDIILRWNHVAFHLEGTTTLGGGWAPISGGSPKSLPASGGLRFFRLVCP